jgi:eukaryotic-like serine/threonine-protein kinase
VADPVELMLADLTARYAETSASESFTRLYTNDAGFGHIFAILHERLNQHFDSINGRARSTKHYWADSSRDMLALIDELDDVIESLRTIPST